ncbi:MAG: 3-deoxy-D-manno-octulosonic acid transferase [Sporomusaceae bacterium]|nr:3-deoxy-D-manno-octulosonic acid transferase [Sporomusaceae bacterium]
MWLLYDIFGIIALVLAIPFFLFRLCLKRDFSQHWLPRMGFLRPVILELVAGRACVWIHAASVGEIVAASPIVGQLRRQMPDRPILISVVTASGYEMANRILVEADAVIYAPLDLSVLTARVIDKIRPAVFVLVETELWPNFIRSLSRRRIPIVMVNGRISERSVRNYRYLGRILKDTLAAIRLFCMQSEQDAVHIRMLGADPGKVIVTGNTKFDQTYGQTSEATRQELYRTLRLVNGDPVIVAGSTHPGEESCIAAAFALIRQIDPRVRLVIAPRQILRAGEVEALFSAWRVVRKTALAGYAGEPPDVVILDTIGELGAIYSIGDIIFVGGSLIPQGGHNVLEPAAHAKPVLVGPHMFNFKDSYALLTQRQACLTVHNAAELTATISELLSDADKRRRMGENALAVIIENQGASERSAVYIKQIVSDPDFRESSLYQ